MKTKKETFASSNGLNQFSYVTYSENEAPKAIIQIAHGMSEHIGRYEEFARFFTRHGFLVCGNDHLGHGETALSPEEFGYFGKRKGWIYMVDDMHRLTILMKEIYGEIPYYIMGHSMGSLLVRAYLSCYGKDISGAILMGTSGKNPVLKFAKPLINTVITVKGDRYRSKLLYTIAFGDYNKKYDECKDKLGWMSQDPSTLECFRNDPKCNFVLTAAGFRDLTEALIFVSRKDWAREVPKELPIFLLSGQMDPVGDYGKGVKQVYNNLSSAGVKDLVMKLYPKSRHELIHEPDKDLVFMDILDWIKKHL